MIWPFSTIADLRSQLTAAQVDLKEADARYGRRMNEIAMLQRALAEAEKPPATAPKVVATPKKVATPTKTAVTYGTATPVNKGAETISTPPKVGKKGKAVG